MVCFMSCTTAMAQTAIHGRVLDEGTNEPLIGATVVEQNTSNGTVTDVDGAFRLTVAKLPVSIKVSYIGYSEKVVTVTSAQPLTIRMQDISNELSETVVIGYSGSIIRSKMTNSIAKVKNESLTTGMFSNPSQALSGAVAGLKVVQGSGNPNASPTIVLRGGTDYDGSGAPLVVVDGMIRSSMADVNPNDIQSMEVMKDAGATAIYGSRANNGVILITTKKGKDGEGKVGFSSKLSWNYFNNPYKFLDAGDYLYYQRRSYLYAEQKGTVTLSSLSGNQPYGTGNKYEADGNKSSAGIWGVYEYGALAPDVQKELIGKGWRTMTDPVTNKTLIYVNNPWRTSTSTPPASRRTTTSTSAGATTVDTTTPAWDTTTARATPSTTTTAGSRSC